MVHTQDIIDKYKLFWQYPAITEKQFYLQEKDNALYFGLPWATIKDKRYNHSLIFNIVRHLVNKDHKYYTCCQHISYKMFIPLWKALNITKVYISHKQVGIDYIDGIELLPCPLFAVNFETKEYNKDFENIDFINVERPILYSFIGGYQPRDYMSNIRKHIFDMKHPDNTDIINTGIWHLDNIVFSNKQNYSGEINKPHDFDYKTSYYNRMLIKSKFTLCPSGSGPNSIRFWEALACGSIPILLSDTLQLPYHELWDKSILRVKESEFNKIPQILSEISEETQKKMRENCIKLYRHLSNNYVNTNINKALFVVGQTRSLIDERMKIKLKEAFKYFKGDIFFVLEKNKINIDLSEFNPREIVYYKFNENNNNIPGCILMSYGWSNCMNLITKYEKINNIKYDIIYKTRPDLLLQNYIPNSIKLLDKEITHNMIRDKKIVWGETIGEYGTNINDPTYAIKDTFNIITRDACEDFFVGFFNSCLNPGIHYPNKPLCNEARLGFFLNSQNVKKEKLMLKRTIVRMSGQKTLYGAKSLDQNIQDIIIENEIILETI